MATSKVGTTEGSGKNIATYSITEDAVTKDIQRTVLSNNAGSDTGVAAVPLQVSLANTAANAVAIKVDGSAATQPISGSVVAAGDVASGSSDSGNPIKIGAKATSTEATAVTTGQRVNLVSDLVGKQIVMPYANKENFISGSNSATGTSGTSVISAQGAGVKIYITSISVANTGATSSLLTIQSDPAGTPVTLWQTISPAGGGSNFSFPVPLVVPANKAVGFTAGSSSTTQYVSISGYFGT